MVDGRVYGLGSNDAKAAVAAMTAAFLAFREADLPFTLALALVEGEETRGTGTEAVLAELARRGTPPAAAVVGEPTGLDVAVAQKGLMVLELVARGEACHAAHAARLGAPTPPAGWPTTWWRWRRSISAPPIRASDRSPWSRPSCGRARRATWCRPRPWPCSTCAPPPACTGGSWWRASRAP